MKTHWTEELLESELRPICDAIGRMPTRSELESLGRSDLCSQLSRRGGFSAWATRLGVERIFSDSDAGWDGERHLAAILLNQGFAVKPSVGVKAPHDLLIDGVIRVDVKTARYAEYGASRGWFYRIGKLPQADIIALFQIDTGACYFLPWPICPTSNMTIARDGGKYARFLNRFDLLRELVTKRESERRIWLEAA